MELIDYDFIMFADFNGRNRQQMICAENNQLCEENQKTEKGDETI